MVVVSPLRCHDSKSQLGFFGESTFMAEGERERDPTFLNLLPRPPGEELQVADRAATDRDPLGECRMPEGKGFVRAATLPFPSLMGESIQRLFYGYESDHSNVIAGNDVGFYPNFHIGKDKQEFNKKKAV